MVRLKIAYWEFDSEAVCPTLDHDLLSQAHIYYDQNPYLIDFPLVIYPEREESTSIQTWQNIT